MYFICSFFFFQAEDGIRDYKVTGVQTCALPISGQSDHQVARAPLAVECQGEALQPREDGDPEIRDHLLAHRFRQDPLAIREKAFQGGDDDHRQAADGEKLHPIRREESSQPEHESAAPAPEQHAVDPPLNRPGTDQVGGDERQHETGGQGEAPSMGLQERTEADEEPGDLPQPVGAGSHHLRASTLVSLEAAMRKISDSSLTLRRASKRRVTWRRASRVLRRVAWGSWSVRAMASARAATSPGVTRSPASPSGTASGIPESLVETTGTPRAIASSNDAGSPSRSPYGATTLGRTKTDAAG